MVLYVDGVSISYPVGDMLDVGLKETIIRKLRGVHETREFLAVDNVSFALEKGDMLGIVGSNGAGKSTLSKAIANVVEPSRGTIWRGGRVTALLELSAGFDPDLTVRENTYLRGALMGFTEAYINEKYDEIIAFSELRAFEERPFKTLSSGMKSRLAFAIATLIDPEILILDEVLSVGDSNFKKKSGDKMKAILANGVTGILVSHSITQVRSLCNKILWLDHGKQIAFGSDVRTICDAYEQFMATRMLPKNEEAFYQSVRAWRERRKKPT